MNPQKNLEPAWRILIGIGTFGQKFCVCLQVPFFLWWSPLISWGRDPGGPCSEKASCCLLHVVILSLQVGCRANCNSSGKITSGVEFRQFGKRNIPVRGRKQLAVVPLQNQPDNIHRILAKGYL